MSKQPLYPHIPKSQQSGDYDTWRGWTIKKVGNNTYIGTKGETTTRETTRSRLIDAINAYEDREHPPVGEISKFTGRKLSLGQWVMTASIASDVADNVAFSAFMYTCLKRHANCDWGDMSAEDIQENNYSLDKHLRLFSSYNLPPELQHSLGRSDKQNKLWIITEADRSSTTILWPEDY